MVRLRPAGPGRTELWGRVPWKVLVTREVDDPVADDVTVSAAALLTDGGSASRRDARWRWPLPPESGHVREEIPAAEVHRLAAAAAGTLREVTESGLDGRPVGSRMLREALLDHVAVVVDPDATEPIRVPQRLVQAAVRMGFVGDDEDHPVRVRVARRWVGLAARYGTAWLPPPTPLAVRPAGGPARRAGRWPPGPAGVPAPPC